MAKIPSLDAVRIIPRDENFLDRNVGSSGQVFYDRADNTLRVYNGVTQGGQNLAKADLTNITNSDFLAKATAAGVSSGGTTSLNASNLTSGTVPVDRIGASGTPSSSTYLRGDNSWATITSTGSSVATTQTAGIVKPGIGLSVSEDGTLNVTASVSLEIIDGLSFTRGVTVREFSTDSTFTDNASDTVPVESAVRAYIDRRLGYTHNGLTIATNELIPAGGSFRYATEEFVNNLLGNFSDLPDATAASLTIDKIYLPAMTMLTVTNSGASAYRFDQYGTTNNPTVFAITGMTIAFNLNASGHPFLIQTPAGANYNTGLIHVSTAGVVSTGASAQGKDSGTLYWKVPTDISGGYRYQCSVHAIMVGSLTVKTIGTL